MNDRFDHGKTFWWKERAQGPKMVDNFKFDLGGQKSAFIGQRIKSDF